jgi:hypothetical protein
MIKKIITSILITTCASALCMEQSDEVAVTVIQSDSDTMARSLIQAILNNNEERIQYLLDNGVDLDESLQYAVQSDIAKSCKALMLLGANPYTQNLEGKTAFDYLRDTWSPTNKIEQILKKEDSWRGWMISKMRLIRSCCRHNKEEKIK